MSNIFVLDACALVALLRNEKGADKVAAVYDKAEKGEAQIFMNRVNLLEVFYGFYREDGKDYAEKIMDGVSKSIITIREFNKGLFNEAGRMKASYRISLADSIALSQAIALNAEFLTSDHHEFDALDGIEPVQFHFIR